MRIPRTLRIIGTVALAGPVLLISLNPSGGAYVTFGFELPTSQRDFRVYNNFTNSQANNNGSASANFPGAVGAVLAIWKGGVEWESRSYGDGSGDPTQGNLGDGGADFDWTWQGETTSVGGYDSNVVSSGASCGGGTLAYAEGVSSNGWRIRFCNGWTWQDGPGDNSSMDIQGVAAHEFGHALGLGHSGTFAATMYASINGDGVPDRSIHSDDINGVQAAYSSATSNKVSITGITGSTAIGGTLTVAGSNFTNSGNEVWFTKSSSNGVPTKVTGVSSSGGGTSLTITIPSGIQDGSINVKSSSSSGKSLSNSWPFEIGVQTGPSISSISPSGADQGSTAVVTVSGAGFQGGASLVLTQGAFQINATGEAVAGSSTLTATVSLSAAPFGPYDVTVTNPDSLTDTLTAGFTVTDPTNQTPVLLSITPDAADAGTTVAVTVLGMDFQPGAQLTIELGPSTISGASELVVGSTLMLATLDLSGAAPGDWDVTVTNPSMDSGTLVGAFAVIDPSPAGSPVITAATPAQPPVIAETPILVTLTGSHFSTVTKVTIDGQHVLEGFGEVFVLGDTSVQFFLPLVDHLGAVPVTLENAVGTSLPFNLDVVPVTSPTLYMQNPIVFTLQEVTQAMASDPGDIHVLWAAWSNQPTPVPGIVDLDIGNFGTSLALWWALPTAATGVTSATFVIPAEVLPGSYWWQGAVANPALDLPAPVTNTVFTAILF